ncbi:phosphoribosylformylglycinamidine cyclo-ligase [Sulfoacidibacillus thermotolerans]|uniref:Phosphoribosylformylglycinamidine cyclo-ligase n=1 Tax=Sulfoacidibacillus thermotolerans TaxID=1765684 RepID=A0A2U3D8Q2_SULT2|nr:phosphoribosylformylglycinamidine cyclo-ligase [Sulfoacidibacillus thermotolerans]PWI57656.1 phosphoribosylformylglycinamidine cyclo-ligase [Sulfoacidibacillus thermotolerans]
MTDLYRAAGVDIDAGNETVERIKPHVKRTLRKEVLGSIGSFGGGFLFPSDQYREPVLVSGTDGVGTKLKLAFSLQRHDTIGIDAVAMCVNDILTTGAQPLFFLDYFATGKLQPKVAEQVVKGIADGCVSAGAALIGGETAEMPGMYSEGEYDIAGFAVGVVERARMIDGRAVQSGDRVIGLASSGPHANGYSLIRKLVKEHGHAYEEPFGDGTHSLGEILLTPTKIYVKPILQLLQTHSVHAMAHITGGGLLENIPRALPEGVGCVIELGRWPVPPIFSWFQTLQEIDQQTLYRTWNMGIGYVLIVAEKDAASVVSALRALGEDAYEIGYVEEGRAGVTLLSSEGLR